MMQTLSLRSCFFVHLPHRAFSGCRLRKISLIECGLELVPEQLREVAGVYSALTPTLTRTNPKDAHRACSLTHCRTPYSCRRSLKACCASGEVLCERCCTCVTFSAHRMACPPALIPCRAGYAYRTARLHLCCVSENLPKTRGSSAQARLVTHLLAVQTRSHPSKSLLNRPECAPMLAQPKILARVPADTLQWLDLSNNVALELDHAGATVLMQLRKLARLALGKPMLPRLEVASGEQVRPVRPAAM